MRNGTALIITAVMAVSMTTSACALNATKMGGGGGIGGSESKANQQGGAPPALRHCARPLGKLVVDEAGFQNVRTAFGGGSPLPAIRQFVQKSNCFTMLATGGAMKLLEEEGASRATGPKADYALTLEPMYNEANSGGAGFGAVLGGLIHPAIGGVVGAARKKSAGIQLTLARKRDREQFSVTGDVSKWDFGGGAGGFGGSFGLFGGAAAGAYENTGGNRMMIAAIYDAYLNLLIEINAH